jgi:hypothetical protein
MTAAQADSHYVKSWPHPNPPLPEDDSLPDPRLVMVIEKALGGGHRRAVIVAEAVWDWLAEGDDENAQPGSAS